MNRKGGLGRGLGALIPNETISGDEGMALQELPIDLVIPNRLQPREHFDEEALVALTASIRELGVLQPVLVRPVDEGFELIAGERRWRSAKRAGLTSIPAIVRPVDDQLSLEHAIVENLHREDLNAIEEATAYQQLIDDFGLTQEEVASRVGKSRSTIANTLRLLHLSVSVQRLMIDGLLGAGHARALVVLSDIKTQEELASRIVADGLTVRQVEAIMRGSSMGQEPSPEADSTSPAPADSKSPPTSTPTRSAALIDLEQLLADHLNTRVGVELGAKRGKVTVEFADVDDLERIARIVVAGDSYQAH
jgi:ParB family chromosome partitioning protein